MNDAFFKPSLNVGSFIGENPSVNTERFLLFIKAYYEWMQSTTLTLTSKTGTFVIGETVVGASSGASATIIEVKANSIIVQLVSRTIFDYSEIVNGQTSSATATISTIKDNIGRASGNLLNYKTLETSVDKYVDYLREELYPSIPATHYGDKRLVAQYFKDFFESKSNEQSYRFLFKLLYDENIEFYYPGTDILRVSDGNFEKTQIIRTVAISADTRDIFLFLNKTIRGETSGVLANVVDIKKFFIGSLEVAEMTLKLVSGTFAAGETIVDIDDEDLSTTIYGIVSSITIVDGGSGYEDGNIITITGNGSEAQAKVSSIKESPISALKVNTIGHGYQLNTEAIINNSGTGGTGFLFEVSELANTYTVTSGANTYTVGEISKLSIINRGEGYFKKPTVTLEDTTISSLGLLSNNLITIVNAGSNYGVGNTLIFTGGAGANAAGQIASVVETTTFDLLFEDGFQMKADGSYYDIIKNEDWLVTGPIKRIELTNFGTGYTSANLPSITISTTTGSSANLIATNIQGKTANVSVDTSNNITGIGSIRAVEITNFGINYSAANASASTIGDGNAILTPVISGLGIKEGVFLDDDGKINFKIIQDSYYYQDYSYVIKSGLAFQTYSDTLKTIIHPAGLQSFGEILLFTELDLTMLMSSTISTIENINEYVVYILSTLDVQNSMVNSESLVEFELALNANTAIIQNDKSYTVFPGSDVISTEIDVINKEYVINIENDVANLSDISVASSISFGFVSDIGLYPTFGDIEIQYLSLEQLLEYSETTFNTTYVPTETYLTAWKLIQGTISFSTYSYSSTQISQYANVQISTLQSATFLSSINHVTGTGTNFLLDFAVNDTFLANNEFGTVSILFSNTEMDIYVPPSSPYTNVPAYKIIAGP
jgi:hypothetical protein